MLFDLKKIESGEDYYNQIVEMIKESELEEPENQRTPYQLIQLWFEEIKEAANENWILYITGKRENFQFTLDEMEKLYNKANERYTNKAIESLLDKELIQCGIDINGEMVFSLTEKVKETVNKIN